jgi:hypothetical protein
MKKFFEKNLLIKNFNNNKNLLLLTGNMRTFRYLLKYHKKFLDHTKSDLIISTWNDADCDIELVKMIKETLKPIYFEIEDYNFNLTTDIFGNLNKFDLLFGKASLSTRSQIYKFVRTIELIKKIEKLQEKKYEVIFKSRPDLFFLSKRNLNIPEKEIVFENTIGNWSTDRSDRFFYGKREEFFRFINSFNENAKKAWDEKSVYPVLNLIPIQEQFVKYCCDKSNITAKPFLPIIKVWRPNKEPNIYSISKIILNVWKKLLFNLILYR